MNQNYPEYILKKLRVFNYLEENDTSRDEEFQALPPEEVFDQVLKFDGIIGYRYTIVRWISDIFKVHLDPMGEEQSLDNVVESIRSIIRAAQRDFDEIITVRIASADDITVMFEKRGTAQ